MGFAQRPDLMDASAPESFGAVVVDTLTIEAVKGRLAVTVIFAGGARGV